MQNKKNYYKAPIKIVVYIIVLLIGVSYIPKDISFLGYTPKHVDIFSDLKISADDSTSVIENENYKEEIKNEGTDDEFVDPDYVDPDYVEPDSDSVSNGDSSKLFNLKTNANMNFAYIPLLKFVRDAAKSLLLSSDVVIERKPAAKLKTHPQPITGNIGQLKYFFEALKNSKNEKLRIAHYGDSAIEGDLITADIRQIMQKKFGGKGVGFLSITSHDIQFRTTTKQSFSNNWDTPSLFTSNPKHYSLGIAGTVSIPKGKAWVNYKTTRRYRTVKTFNEAHLFYSNAKRNASITYSIDNKSSKTVKLKSGKRINEVTLKAGYSATQIKINFPKKEMGHFYGVSLEGGNGIYVDNFPLRGNTGTDLQQIEASVFRDFSKKMNYKLIILEFGLNAASSIKGNFSWYEREMEKVINKLKKAFPKTSIIVFSVHDKSKKKGSKFETDPVILKLIKAQKNVVRKTRVAFWNMWESMGGKNSMPKWVADNPPKAFKDYTHFNGQGAKLIAKMFSNALIRAYNKHR